MATVAVQYSIIRVTLKGTLARRDCLLPVPANCRELTVGERERRVSCHWRQARKQSEESKRFER